MSNDFRVQHRLVQDCIRCKRPYYMHGADMPPDVCVTCVELEWRIERDPTTYPIPLEVRCAMKHIKNHLSDFTNFKIRNDIKVVSKYLHKIGERRIKERRTL